MQKKFILVFLFIIFFSSFSYAKVKTEIIYKLNNEIITNIDIENEKKFLIFLNSNLKNVSDKQIEIISRNSIKNRKIKEIELTNYFDIKEANFGAEYLEKFIAKYENKENFLDQLNKAKLDYNFFEKNIVIDNLWRKLIFDKFRSQVKVNVDGLSKQIKNQESEIEEFNMSEIFFEMDKNISFESLKKNIYDEIKNSGFDVAASIYSISESKNYGGKIGWIKSNQISKKIFNQIKLGQKITEPIKLNNGYLIIKINERRTIKEKINFEEELKKLILIEKEKELNKFSYIYFNKIKKRIFISEN